MIQYWLKWKSSTWQQVDEKTFFEIATTGGYSEYMFKMIRKEKEVPFKVI